LGFESFTDDGDGLRKRRPSSLKIAMADAKPAAPTHHPKDDLAFKMTPFEI
jgi:hypothetical protein